MREWTVEFTYSDRPILNRHDGTAPVTYPKEFTQALKETVRAHNAAIEKVRTETLAECRAATEQQICDLQDRAAIWKQAWWRPDACPWQ